jgi:hypothetical protein
MSNHQKLAQDYRQIAWTISAIIGSYGRLLYMEAVNFEHSGQIYLISSPLVVLGFEG